jgi:Na+-transporting NADH:ubiquinone oxidoreductase subunit NqrB
MFWKIVLVLGILGVLLGFLVTGVSVALPIVNGPHTSWDEAMLGIIPGAFVLVVSFFVFLLGLIFVIVNRKKKA